MKFKKGQGVVSGIQERLMDVETPADTWDDVITYNFNTLYVNKATERLQEKICEE